MSLVLGMDLSYTRSGLVGITENYKVDWFKTISVPTGPLRMHRVALQFTKALEGWAPALCIIEDYAYGAPGKQVLVKLAELGGVVKMVLECRKIDYLCISPSKIKSHITGKGTAGKDIVARELGRLHGIKFDKDPGYDLSDAAACACWGVAHLKGVK
jgi:Holliday junction resolvasome RuvABC endonuclease subunit